MPGITGWTNTSNHASDMDLDAMIEPVSLPWYKTSRYRDDTYRFAIGHSDLDRQSGDTIETDTNSGITACVHGFIYEPSLQGEKLLQYVINCYKEKGSDFAQDLHGEFNIVIFDRKQHRMLLVNDRYARRPLYYCTNNGKLLFSSSMRSLTRAVSLQADISAIADFLTLSLIPGERTLLNNVHRLDTAGVLIFDTESGKQQLQRYWKIEDHLASNTGQENDMLDQLDSAFRRAVERRLFTGQTNWLSLSAGMDSRAVAAMLCGSEHDIHTETSGIEGSYENIVTSKISNKLGAEHLFYTFDESSITGSSEQLYDLLKEAILLTDGMRGTGSSAMTAFTSRERHKNQLQSLLTGHGGEIIKLDEAYNFAIINEGDVSQIQKDAASWAFQRLHRPNAPALNVASLYRGELAEAIKTVPADHVKQSLHNIDSTLPAEQIASYLFVNELYRNRAALALSVQRAYTDTHTPFYDDEVLGIAMNMPLQSRRQYNVHKHIISNNCPELLNIVLSETRMPPFPGIMDKLCRGIPYRVFKRLGFYKRDVPENYFAATANLKFFRQLLLDERTLDRGLYDANGIKKVLDAQASGRSTANTLTHLLTINEIWHREVMD